MRENESNNQSEEKKYRLYKRRLQHRYSGFFAEERRNRIQALLGLVREKQRIPLADFFIIAQATWSIRRATVREYLRELVVTKKLKLNGPYVEVETP